MTDFETNPIGTAETLKNLRENFLSQSARLQTAEFKLLELKQNQVYIDRKEFSKILARALNTLEPQLQPVWATPLADMLELDMDIVLVLEDK